MFVIVVLLYHAVRNYDKRVEGCRLWKDRHTN